MRERSGARGGRDILEEHHRVNAVVAQQRVRKSEGRVDEREVRRRAEGWGVHLREWTPCERVPHGRPLEVRRAGRVPGDLERQEESLSRTCLQEMRRGV